MTERSDEEDLFDKLINYHDDEPSRSETMLKKTKFTFLEPNIDITTNFSLKLPKTKKNYKLPAFSDTNAYLLAVVEQPQQCRMSGYGEKDRRPIDPAPIVELIVLNCDQNHLVEDELESPFYVVHVSLWTEDMQTQLDLIEGSAPYSMRFLIGSLVSSPTLLKNLQGQKGNYFAFPDLSVRMTGRYRLHFSLVHLAVNKVITEVFSDPFTVYSAKNYPGMKESSEISKHLAKQGLKLTVRTQIRGKK